MTMTALDRALMAGDAGRVTGEQQERPGPEMPEKGRRRTFTAQYKLDVVAEYDATAAGEKGAVLRRGGRTTAGYSRGDAVAEPGLRSSARGSPAVSACLAVISAYDTGCPPSIT
jgi:hypothetical protein